MYIFNSLLILIGTQPPLEKAWQTPQKNGGKKILSVKEKKKIICGRREG